MSEYLKLNEYLPRLVAKRMLDMDPDDETSPLALAVQALVDCVMNPFIDYLRNHVMPDFIQGWDLNDNDFHKAIWNTIEYNEVFISTGRLLQLIDDSSDDDSDDSSEDELGDPQN